MRAPPRARVPQVWSESLGPFVLASGRGEAVQQTEIRVRHDGHALHVRFDCRDRDIWATLHERDAPLYQEEVVELFVAAGAEDPTDYLEFEVNPLGALFDARVTNPTSRRQDMTVDPGWSCPGIRWRAESDPAAGRWSAELVVPWSSIVGSDAIPAVLRANFFRIERPRDAEPEFSCWSATFTEPPDFHKPRCFGFLEVER